MPRNEAWPANGRGLGKELKMDLLLSPQFRLALVFAGLVILWNLETLAPLFRLRAGRFRHAVPNLGLTVLVILLNFSFAGASAWVAAWSIERRIGLLSLAELPAWAVCALGIVALDFFAYLAHVGLHYSPLGWRIHRVHHSDMHVDVTTAFRQHPGETLVRIAFQVAAVVVFGIPLTVVLVYLSASALNAQLEHANFNLPEKLDRILRWVIVTPNMHKAHHSREKRETNSNYSNIFSIWDRAFRTYTPHVDFERLSYGLNGFDSDEDQTLMGLLRLPVRKVHPKSAKAVVAADELRESS